MRVALRSESTVNIRKTIIGVSVLILTGQACAVSLGGAKGDVVLGSKADLVFDVSPSPGQDLDSSCIKATALSGDTPISASAVRVTPLPDVKGRKSAVKVQILQAIDEPVLTIKLVAGCSGAVSRTYSFLADLPRQVPLSAAPIDIRTMSAAPDSMMAQPKGNRAKGASAASGDTVNRTPRTGPTVEKAAAAQRTKTAASAPVNPSMVAKPETGKLTQVTAETSSPQDDAQRVRPTKGRAADNKARLVVEPLDLWIDTPLALRLNPALMSMPAIEQTAERVKAADLWRVLNTPVESMAESLNKTDALTGEVAVLREKSEADAKTAAGFQKRAEQAEKERFPAEVVYGMSCFLLLSMGGAFFLWRRLQAVPHNPFLQKTSTKRRESLDGLSTLDGTSAFDPQTDFGSSAFDKPQSSKRSSAKSVQEGSVAQIGGTWKQPDLKGSAVLSEAAAPMKAVPAANAVSIGQQRAINPEELFDIQQQAEFFVSVGEHQQAIDVLKNHLQNNDKKSPLAYLELLRLYHTLIRPEDFAHLRADFMAQFNAFVPEFSRFARPSRSLDRYNDALAEIESEWISPGVVPLLEALLFREVGAPSGVLFDLAAFDDLLLLWSVARTTAPNERGPEGVDRQRTTPEANNAGFEQATAFAVSGMTLPPELSADRPAGPMDATLEQEFGLLLPRDASPSHPVSLEPTLVLPTTRSAAVSSSGLDFDLSQLDGDDQDLAMPSIKDDALPSLDASPHAFKGEDDFDFYTDDKELQLELERLEKELPKKK